ncbi:ATP-binding protein (plasmid) [Halarchaeum sp. CBA1220]|uniref:ATP-binding protein n=1 Tax=Halarchaeum sp. CBA1220 TaxID=1853682 RepID=UPI0011CDD27F|nr:ATP-binding protein [Halarchaeum sp. CBA1220]QLC35084.1 ATP-binding protein [Halarchaeum sp. CBA1220]
MASTPDLPVPVEASRVYYEVRPSADVVTPEAATGQANALYDLLAVETGWRTPRPALEVVVAVDAEGDLTYAFGVTESALDRGLERALRGLFPASYEIKRVRQPTGWLRADASAALAGVTYRSRGERARDWQLPVRPFASFRAHDADPIPLAGVVEALLTPGTPGVFQALVRARPEWTRDAETRAAALEAGRDTLVEQVLDAVWPRDPTAPPSRSLAAEERLSGLEERDTRVSFDVTASLLYSGPDAEAAAREATGVFGCLRRGPHRIVGREHTAERAVRLRDAIVERTTRRPLTGCLRAHFSRHPQCVVLDRRELAGLLVLDGPSLTTSGGRALNPTPGERRKLPRPPSQQLEAYREPGLTLGRALDADGHPEADIVSLPPRLQRLHCVWIGKSGAGKTTALTTGALANRAATRGANVIIEPKGDGMAQEYLRAHYAQHGSLADVHYFDCRTLLPALSILDVRPDLEAGRERADAVTDRIDHTMDVLRQLVGAEQFDAAIRSPTVIRYGLRAAFDPVHGQDAYALRDLQDLLHRLHDRATPPPTVDPDVERALEELTATHHQTFDQVMGGAATRLEHLSANPRLAQVFNHTPEADDPVFRFDDYLDTQATIIFDLGGLREETKRGLSLVLLSLLWSALKRRTQRAIERGESEPLPLVNLYVEEAASIAGSTTLASVLREGRAFDVSVTLATQYPSQLRSADPDLYRELLNDVSTLVVGNVGLDRDLAARLATSEEDPGDVANRLRALRRGEWLCSLPAGFDRTEPRPFVVRSAPLPPGHPESARPLTASQETAYRAARARLDARTETALGQRFDAHYATPSTTAEPASDADPTTIAASETDPATLPRTDSLLPYTTRFPAGIEYDADRHAIRCLRCHTTHNPRLPGVQDAIACCGSLDAVDRDDIPVCECHLKLTPEEIAASEWTLPQLRFLQVVWNAQSRRLHPLEYDVRRDSMVRLREYTDIDVAGVDELVDAGLLTDHGRYPHQLYSLTPAGRDAIGEHNRTGIVHGDGQGDLGETTVHVMLVDLARDYLERDYLENPDSTVVRVEPYYELADGHRLDLAGLDATGEIVLTVEAERINHDVATAVLEDYDKMAACHPNESIWVVVSQPSAVRVLDALHDPTEGDPRITHVYSENTPIDDYRYDTPGLTAVYTANALQRRLFTDD